mmetsp:Transcript_12326/g.20411  ORF Transcript_12326/g.20411 Transcript_12326/m.20411 type:complete len:103 (+) Transcript_12326:116-424(+)
MIFYVPSTQLSGTFCGKMQLPYKAGIEDLSELRKQGMPSMRLFGELPSSMIAPFYGALLCFHFWHVLNDRYHHFSGSAYQLQLPTASARPLRGPPKSHESRG